MSQRPWQKCRRQARVVLHKRYKFDPAGDDSPRYFPRIVPIAGKAADNFRKVYCGNAAVSYDARHTLVTGFTKQKGQQGRCIKHSHLLVLSLPHGFLAPLADQIADSVTGLISCIE